MWIKEKYVEKRFVQNSSSGAARKSNREKTEKKRKNYNKAHLDSFIFVSERHRNGAGLRLYRAALAGDLVAMAAALAEGAEVNGSIADEEGRTALIGAAVGVRRRRNPTNWYQYQVVVSNVSFCAACRGHCWPVSSCC